MKRYNHLKIPFENDLLFLEPPIFDTVFCSSLLRNIDAECIGGVKFDIFETLNDGSARKKSTLHDKRCYYSVVLEGIAVFDISIVASLQLSITALPVRVDPS